MCFQKGGINQDFRKAVILTEKVWMEGTCKFFVEILQSTGWHKWRHLLETLISKEEINPKGSGDGENSTSQFFTYALLVGPYWSEMEADKPEGLSSNLTKCTLNH